MDFKGMTPQQAAEAIVVRYADCSPAECDKLTTVITTACQHFSNEALERARAQTLPFLIERILKQNTAAGWHHDPVTGEYLSPDDGWWAKQVNLIHSEISEAVEGRRKGLMDDHLPHRKMEEVEMADAIIRILHLAGRFEYDLAGAIEEKLQYNAKRADHKPENRAAQGGKKF